MCVYASVDARAIFALDFIYNQSFVDKSHLT